MKAVISLILLLLLFTLNTYCQSSATVASLPIISIKSPELKSLIDEVFSMEKERKYYTDTLYYSLDISKTTFEYDLEDTVQSVSIKKGTPLYIITITPRPDGFAMLKYNNCSIVKYQGHNVLLTTNTETALDDLLYTPPIDSVHIKKLLLSEPFEDDRWPDYYCFIAYGVGNQIITGFFDIPIIATPANGINKEQSRYPWK